MRAEQYPVINVLNVFRGVPGKTIPYQITPYRFSKSNGEVYHIKQIRHFHKNRSGKGWHFHYIISTRERRRFRLLFDTNSFTWRLLEEIKDEL